MLEKAIEYKLRELQELLSLLDPKEFTSSDPALENASLGQHFRHIIELFECLVNGYDIGLVDYDKRQRALILENDRFAGISKLEEIISKIGRPDKVLELTALADAENSMSMPTNYHRELLYNLEHLIHHEAIMKAGLKKCPNIRLPEFFGYAPSTIKFIKSQTINTN